MHTRFGFALCLAVMGLSSPGSTLAQDDVDSRRVSYDELAALGDEIEEHVSYRDNVFLSDQRSKQIRQQAQGLPGGKLTFTVAVKRVLEKEVILFVPDARNTRIVLKHVESPIYGNLRTVMYCGSLTTQFAQILSKPMSLRIGSEIPLKIAQELRKGDLLEVNGRLETVHLLLEVFEPHAVAVISAVQFSRIKPQNASTDYFYQ